MDDELKFLKLEVSDDEDRPRLKLKPRTITDPLNAFAETKQAAAIYGATAKPRVEVKYCPETEQEAANFCEAKPRVEKCADCNKLENIILEIKKENQEMKTLIEEVYSKLDRLTLKNAKLINNEIKLETKISDLEKEKKKKNEKDDALSDTYVKACQNH